jgi:choline dehydrogenase
VTDWKVLLLEVGGEEPNLADVPAFQPFTEESRLNWYYGSVPDSRFCSGKSCAFMTGKGLGGSSLHNEMMYSRGNRRIFDMWEEMGVFCIVRHSNLFALHVCFCFFFL